MVFLVVVLGKGGKGSLDLVFAYLRPLYKSGVVRVLDIK